MKKTFYQALKCDTIKAKMELAKEIGISKSQLDYFNDNHLCPTDNILEIMELKLGIKPELIMLRMGIFNQELLERLSEQSDDIFSVLHPSSKEKKVEAIDQYAPKLITHFGKLYDIDCIKLMRSMKPESVDLIFADPPFNLDKFYLSEINDALPENQYLDWSLKWIDETIRILKPGGSFFLWNLPKWNAKLAGYISDRLNFRHWIATDIKYRLPIKGRLYPSHYSLLYFTKGSQPNTFEPDRLPMETCPKCFKELKDYGGYKNKMNPKGINLTDVWYDIPPVRHKKYKKRKEANELSIKLLDRIIEMSSVEGDIIFDPFGGSGTTYAIAEIKKRKWIGTEIGPLDSIIERFEKLEEDEMLLKKYRKNLNKLFTDEVKSRRNQLKIWTDETIRKTAPTVSQQ